MESRFRDDEEGFTLVELMVVVLVISILISIAVPTYAGARNRASDRQAQVNLRNTLSAARANYADTQDYTVAATPAALAAAEPALSFNGWGATTPTEIFVYNPSPNFLVLGTLSKTGTCFWMRDIPSGPGAGTMYYSNLASNWGGSCWNDDWGGSYRSKW